MFSKSAGCVLVLGILALAGLGSAYEITDPEFEGGVVAHVQLVPHSRSTGHMDDLSGKIMRWMDTTDTEKFKVVVEDQNTIAVLTMRKEDALLAKDIAMIHVEDVARINVAGEVFTRPNGMSLHDLMESTKREGWYYDTRERTLARARHQEMLGGLGKLLHKLTEKHHNAAQVEL